MNTIKTFSNDELSAIHRGDDLLKHVPSNPFGERPDVHLVSENGGVAVACCSLWWKECASLEGESCGAIGHFFARDDIAGKRILGEGCSMLRDQGVNLALGPMNGNTWRKYRFVTDGTEEPCFAMEPENPSWWPELWTSEGFSAVGGYHSSLITDLNESDPRLERVEKRLLDSGIRIRELDKERFAEDLEKIYEVSRVSFMENFLYTPLEQEEFCGMYLPFKDAVDTRFALIAEKEGQSVAFVFSLPDFAQLQRTGSCDTLIIKTLAVVPGRSYAGLGVVLVDRMRAAAQDAGMRRVIHALMYDGNNSANIGKNSSIMRRYTLYRRDLAG